MPSQTSSLVFLQYLSTVFDNIADAVLLLSIEGADYRLLTANEAYFNISGYGRDTVGELLSEFVRPTANTFMQRKFKQAMRTKKIVAYTHWSEAPAGLRAYSVKIIPIFNTVGAVVQLAYIARDLTEQLKMEEELRGLREQRTPKA